MQNDTRLGIRVLGPLAVVGEGGGVVRLAPKPRTVLAQLAMGFDRTVSTESMVGGLWEEAPPRTATAAVQTYIGQVRRELAAAMGVGPACVARSVLVTEDHGYRLASERVDLDVVRYTRLTRQGCEAATAGDHPRARRLFREALDLWRGPALANVEGGLRLSAQAGRLDEARIATLEHWVRAGLNSGEHADVIGDLVEITALHPLHEIFHEYLVLAYYRGARRAEALATFSSLRGRLLRELGIDLSPRLRDLQQAVLRDDPRLFDVMPGALSDRSPTGTTM